MPLGGGGCRPERSIEQPKLTVIGVGSHAIEEGLIDAPASPGEIAGGVVAPGRVFSLAPIRSIVSGLDNILDAANTSPTSFHRSAQLLGS